MTKGGEDPKNSKHSAAFFFLFSGNTFGVVVVLCSKQNTNVGLVGTNSHHKSETKGQNNKERKRKKEKRVNIKQEKA